MKEYHKKLAKLPKHKRHLLRIFLFVLAALIGIFLHKHSGITVKDAANVTADLLLGTAVDRIFPQGSFLGSIGSN